jgi:ATP-independent RNA helicase DbpA
MHASGTSYMILGEDEFVPPFINDEAEKVTLPVKYSLPDKTKWVTLYIGAGKKDKINKVDIVGLLLQKGKLGKDELGKVEVLDNSAYAAVLRTKANSVVALVKEERLKNKKVKIEISQ